MTSWLFSGWFQKSGSEICCSVVASSALLDGASKIAPHSVGLLAERNVFSFQFFQSHRESILAVRRRVAKKYESRTTGLRPGDARS